MELGKIMTGGRQGMDGIDPHDVGQRLFDDAYVLVKKEFTDGDERTVLEHIPISWSSVNYIQVQLWLGREELWIEYYENDIRRTRDVWPVDLSKLKT